MKKYILNIFFILSITFFYSFSQNEVKILQSDYLQNHTINKEKYDMFCGDVIAQYKNHKLYCDTIFISNDGKYVKANSKKKSTIKDSEGARIESKIIEFFKNDSIINFTEKVIFKKQKNEIQTDNLIYNPDKKIIYYRKGGKLIEDDNIISSQTGLYYTKDEFGQFSESVSIKTKSYEIKSENLDLDNKNNIIFLNSRSIIQSEDVIIEGDWGILDKSKESLNVWGNGIVNSKNRIIYSDSIYIDKNKEKLFYGNTELHEKENIKIYCQNLFEKEGYSEFKGNPKIEFNSESGNIIIEADEMQLNNKDSILLIKNNTYIFSDSIQGKCKNSKLNLKSEAICMLQDPVLWTTKNQISGDTIYIFTKNEILDSLYIPNKSFIISKKKNNYFNQIKGKELQGKFKNGKLTKIMLRGNTKLKYFETDSSNKISGLNDIICSSILISIKENEINNIKFNSKPEAIYTPKKLLNTELLIMDGFIDRFKEKRY